jgi:hypothetical protein
MKKITLVLVALVAFINNGFSQANFLVEGPQNNGSTTQVRAPNGTSAYAYHRAIALVLQSDLTNIPLGTSINAFGYTLTAGATLPVNGNFTVYVENTTDVSYLKGTNWPLALTGMSVAYASVMTIPAAVGTCSILVTLSTPFIYTGGGLYIATDWASAGPYSSTPATYLADNGLLLNPGCASANAAVSPAPTALSTTAFRPSFLFGFPNPYTNDMKIVGMEAPGRVAQIFNTGHNVIGVVKNTGSQTQSNISVSLTVSGANAFTNSQIISSLAPGAVTSVTFASFNPQNPGLNTLSVSVAPDQNNTNNLSTYAQSVTCSTWGQNPSSGSYTNAIGFTTGSGIILSKMLNPVSSTLTGINFALSNDVTAVGIAGYGVLMNAAGVIIATTNTTNITTPMLGTVQNFAFPVWQTLAPGTVYYIGLAQPTPGAPAGAFVTPYVIPNVYFSTPLIGGAFTAISLNFGYFNIQAVFTPSIQLSSTSTIVCSGSTASISVSGPTSYTWSQGSSQLGVNQQLIVSPLVGTLYSLAGTSTLGCNYTASYSLAVNPLPNVAILSPTNAICIGSSISFTPSGAVTYSLNNAATPPSVTDTPTINTSYLITGTDANGCVNTASLSVTVISLTVTVPSNTAICKGKTLSLSAGPATYGYNWLTGTGNIPFATLSNISPTATTIYTLIATDVNQCSQSNTVMVTVNPNPTVTAIATRSIICKGEPVTITASGAATYTWSNNANNAAITVSPITNTTYVVTGATGSGCTHSIAVLQIVNACTGLSELKNSGIQVTIYPNPNTGVFVVNSESFGIVKTVEIYSSLGLLVKKVELNAERTEIDLSGEHKGVYLLQVIENNKRSGISKIIKE